MRPTRPDPEVAVWLTSRAWVIRASCCNRTIGGPIQFAVAMIVWQFGGRPLGPEWIAARLGVSRTSVYLALDVLVRDGVVASRGPRTRPKVLTIDTNTMDREIAARRGAAA